MSRPYFVIDCDNDEVSIVRNLPQGIRARVYGEYGSFAQAKRKARGILLDRKDKVSERLRQFQKSRAVDYKYKYID